jgi:hypothetical protein
MAKSVSYSNDVLDALFGSGSPATLYFGLYTDMPDPDGTGGTEVTGGSYARSSKTNNNTNFPAASGAAKSNATAITFATASALWGNVVGVGVFAAGSGGTPYYFGELENDRTVDTGDVFSFAIDQLVFTEA